LPKFSQTCPKSCRATFADCFYDVTSKKWLSLVFLQTLGAIFEVKQRWAAFLPRFSVILSRYLGILPGFSTNQNF